MTGVQTCALPIFGKPAAALPLAGVMRLVVLAGSDADASDTATRAYRAWLGHMRLLWDRHGLPFPLNLPPDIGPMCEVGAAYVGTAAGFARFVETAVAGIGATYLACDVAFGDMRFDEAMRTTELIGRDVIPAFRPGN